MSLTDKIRTRVTDHTPGVGYVFIVCGSAKKSGCGRVIPYYRLYGGIAKNGCPYCDGIYFSPKRIPEWKAAWFLFWGWLTGRGDPRMPMRKVASKYA